MELRVVSLAITSSAAYAVAGSLAAAKARSEANHVFEQSEAN